MHHVELEAQREGFHWARADRAEIDRLEAENAKLRAMIEAAIAAWRPWADDPSARDWERPHNVLFDLDDAYRSLNEAANA